MHVAILSGAKKLSQAQLFGAAAHPASRRFDITTNCTSRRSAGSGVNLWREDVCLLPPRITAGRPNSSVPLMSGLQRDCLGWSCDGLGAITSALHPFNPTTFKQLSLPIRIVVHVIIVILFSKTSPLSVTLQSVGRRHILDYSGSQGQYPEHVKMLISSNSLYNQIQKW